MLVNVICSRWDQRVPSTSVNVSTADPLICPYENVYLVNLDQNSGCCSPLKRNYSLGPARSIQIVWDYDSLSMRFQEKGIERT